jgi:hypothetical protein
MFAGRFCVSKTGAVYELHSTLADFSVKEKCASEFGRKESSVPAACRRIWRLEAFLF